jgi:hypothetical protein
MKSQMPEGLRTLLARRMPTDTDIEALFRPSMHPARDRTIFFVASTSEVDRPTGGHQMQYRQVDILNRNGIDASVLHLSPGFRHTWFDNDTRISYLSPGLIGINDILVIPETFGCMAASLASGVKKVIYNQNCYYTFSSHPLSEKDVRTPYFDETIVAVLVVSNDSRRYLGHAFPNIPIYRIRHCIDSNVFYPRWPKQRLISCMTRKGIEHLRQVVNILKVRGVFAKHAFKLVVLDKCTERDVGTALGASLIYLNTTEQEGFGLPAAEAMASGCLVIGFHGQGSAEFMTPEYAYPIASGDILEFAKTLENVVSAYSDSPGGLQSKAEQASAFIQNHYNQLTEEQDIIEAWTAIIAKL